MTLALNFVLWLSNRSNQSNWIRLDPSFGFFFCEKLHQEIAAQRKFEIFGCARAKPLESIEDWICRPLHN